MAYKDVMMLNDEEVSLHLYMHVCKKRHVLFSIVLPLLYCAPFFQ